MKRVLASLAVAALALPVWVSATKPDPEHKVTICHRTDSASNPYVKIEVDEASVDGDTGNDKGQGDHYAEHKGVLVTNEAEAAALKAAKVKWGDIIPPVAGHNGLNWTSDGQAIYNNDCKYVPPVTVDNPNDTKDEDVTVPTLPTIPEDQQSAK